VVAAAGLGGTLLRPLVPLREEAFDIDRTTGEDVAELEDVDASERKLTEVAELSVRSVATRCREGERDRCIRGGVFAAEASFDGDEDDAAG